MGDSFAAIADAVSEHTKADRVCVFQANGNGFQLVASSTQPTVDRRARQVRLLESLVSVTSRRTDSFRFVVGDSNQIADDGESKRSLDEYLASSGARILQIETVSDQESNSIAALLLENFSAENMPKEGTDDLYREISTLVQSALRSAVERDNTALSKIGAAALARTVSQKLRGRKSMFAFVVLAIVSVVPLELLQSDQPAFFGPTGTA